ncbi:MAG: hypothetical protein OXS47_13060 [Chloroflexota bacterium]|nr:hypothetical protein [Chloroflexota bacterium]
MRHRWTIAITAALLLSLTALAASAPRTVDAATPFAEDDPAPCGAVLGAMDAFFEGEIDGDDLNAIVLALCGVPRAGDHTGTLVSNANQVPLSATSSAWDQSQAFTTGEGYARYDITSVTFTLAAIPSGTAPTYQVRIQAADSSGKPTGPILGTFTASGPLVEGANTFTFSGGGSLQLAPGTTYALVLDVTAAGGNSGQDGKAEHTASDDEDAGGVMSFSIANGSWRRSFTSTGAFSTLQTSSLKFSFSGSASGIPAFTLTLLQLQATLPDDSSIVYVQATHCGGTPNPAHSWDTNPGPYRTYYCKLTRSDADGDDTSRGEWVGGRIPRAGVDYAAADQIVRYADHVPNLTPGADYKRDCSYSAPAYRWDPVTKTHTRVGGNDFDPITGRCQTPAASSDSAHKAAAAIQREQEDTERYLDDVLNDPH